MLEQVHALAAFLGTFSVLYPQIQGIDLRQSASELPIPVYLVLGPTRAPRPGRPRQRVVRPAVGAAQAPRRP